MPTFWNRISRPPVETPNTGGFKGPEPSRFSFVVCLCIILSLSFGFLGGFISAGFTFKQDYGSVYHSLLEELEHSKTCIEREKIELGSLVKVYQSMTYFNNSATPRSPKLHKKRLESKAYLPAKASTWAITDKINIAKISKHPLRKNL